MTRPTVFRARRIVTLAPGQPEATHVAVREGRILAVGDHDRMRAWGDCQARVDRALALEARRRGVLGQPSGTTA